MEKFEKMGKRDSIKKVFNIVLIVLRAALDSIMLTVTVMALITLNDNGFNLHNTFIMLSNYSDEQILTVFKTLLIGVFLITLVSKFLFYKRTGKVIESDLETLEEKEVQK
jgi:hypothetical protein